MCHRECDSPELSYGKNGISSLTAHKPVVKEGRYAIGPVTGQNCIMGTADVPQGL